jgi:hypothetical protein
MGDPICIQTKVFEEKHVKKIQLRKICCCKNIDKNRLKERPIGKASSYPESSSKHNMKFFLFCGSGSPYPLNSRSFLNSKHSYEERSLQILRVLTALLSKKNLRLTQILTHPDFALFSLENIRKYTGCLTWRRRLYWWPLVAGE